MDLEMRREFTIAQSEMMRANKQHHLLSFTVTMSQIEFTSITNEYHSRTWPDTLKDIHQSYKLYDITSHILYKITSCN